MERRGEGRYAKKVCRIQIWVFNVLSLFPRKMDRDYLIKSDLGGTGEAASRQDGQGVPIPDHQLLRCIGSGSYGEVWLARNMMGV